MGTLVGNQDLAFFDDRNREVTRLAGTTDVLYYALNFKATARDPLYNEPIEEIHRRNPVTNEEGIQFNALVEYPERSQRTGEEGQHTDYDAVLWIPRVDFDQKYPLRPTRPDGPTARTPIIGDVVRVQGRYYDVMSFQEEGQLNDTIRKHVNWHIKLKNRSEFDARRRLEGQI